MRSPGIPRVARIPSRVSANRDSSLARVAVRSAPKSMVSRTGRDGEGHRVGQQHLLRTADHQHQRRQRGSGGQARRRRSRRRARWPRAAAPCSPGSAATASAAGVNSAVPDAGEEREGHRGAKPSTSATPMNATARITSATTAHEPARPAVRRRRRTSARRSSAATRSAISTMAIAHGELEALVRDQKERDVARSGTESGLGHGREENPGARFRPQQVDELRASVWPYLPTKREGPRRSAVPV